MPEFGGINAAVSGARLTRRNLLLGAGAAVTLLSSETMVKAQGAPAKALKKISLGEITLSATSWPRVAADKKGFFTEEGVVVDTVVVQGGPPSVVQQVVGGSLDIGISNFDAIIRAIQAGAPITMAGSSMLKIPFALVSKGDVKTAADLKGKTVCVSTNPKGPDVVYLKRWLQNNGVSPNDVSLIYVGAAPDRLAALVNGTVAASSLTQPFDFRAIEMGYHRLADFGILAGDYGFLGMTCRKDWLTANADTIRAFMRAEKRGSDWVHDPANKAEAIDMLAAEIHQKKEIVEQNYKYYFDELKPFSRDLSIAPANVQAILDLMVEANDIKPPLPPFSKFVDLSYLPK
jgi:ABC-type nitrate/sulfonate/bicarbonate transport system substrate-binding protein